MTDNEVLPGFGWTIGPRRFVRCVTVYHTKSRSSYPISTASSFQDQEYCTCIPLSTQRCTSNSLPVWLEEVRVRTLSTFPIQRGTDLTRPITACENPCKLHLSQLSSLVEGSREKLARARCLAGCCGWVQLCLESSFGCVFLIWCVRWNWMVVVA